MAQKYHSGENCPKSGHYNEFDKNGKVTVNHIKVEKNEKFPPARQKDSYFEEE